MRSNLYKNLNGMYSFYQANISSTRDTLEEQSSAIDIVENELNEAKRRLKIIEEDKYNKLRLVEINNYYGEQYSDHTSIMKLIIMICVPVLILSILFNKGLLSESIFNVLIIAIFVIGAIFLGKHLYKTMTKDNMNYQQYNWWFDLKTAPQVNTDNTSSSDPWFTGALTCIGSACCDTNTSQYDVNSNMCIPLNN